MSQVTCAVGGDDAAEGRDLVARVGALVGDGDVVVGGDAAGRGVLDDDDGRVVELGGGAPGGVGVEVVEVGHLQAVEELGGEEAAWTGRERRLR